MGVPVGLGGPTPSGPGIAAGGPPGGPAYPSDPFYPRDRERGPIDLMRDRERDLRDRERDRIELLRMADRERDRDRTMMDPRDPTTSMRPDRADMIRGPADSRAVADLRDRDRGDRVDRDAREVKRIKTEGRKMDRQGNLLFSSPLYPLFLLRLTTNPLPRSVFSSHSSPSFAIPRFVSISRTRSTPPAQSPLSLPIPGSPNSFSQRSTWSNLSQPSPRTRPSRSLFSIRRWRSHPKAALSPRSALSAFRSFLGSQLTSVRFSFRERPRSR